MTLAHGRSAVDEFLDSTQGARDGSFCAPGRERAHPLFVLLTGAMCACARSLARFVVLPYSFTRVAL